MTGEYDGAILRRRIAREAENMRVARGKVVAARAYVKVTLGRVELYCRFFDVGTVQETDAAKHARRLLEENPDAQWAVSSRCEGALKECPLVGASTPAPPVEITRRGREILARLARGDVVASDACPKIALRLAKAGLVERGADGLRLTPKGKERLVAK